LDALGVELCLVGIGEFVVDGSQGGFELGAGWRNLWFGDLARVLRGGGEGDCEERIDNVDSWRASIGPTS
jgi:hypothetical protein